MIGQWPERGPCKGRQAVVRRVSQNFQQWPKGAHLSGRCEPQLRHMTTQRADHGRALGHQQRGRAMGRPNRYALPTCAFRLTKPSASFPGQFQIEPRPC